MSLRTVFATASLVLAAAPAWAHDEQAAVAEVTELARAFVAEHEAAAPDATLVHAFDHPGRRGFDYLPVLERDDNAGPRLGELSLDERRRLHALLRGLLGEEGFLRVQAIRGLEERLAELEPESTIRVPDAYATRFFGRPAANAPWAFEFEGHHLSVNATVVGGELRGTPLFLGANPAEVEHGADAGVRVLARQEDLARELLASFDAEQRSRALAGPFDWERIIAPGAAEPPAPAGLPATDMRPEQRALLRELVASYADHLRPEFAARELARLDAAGLEALHFAWFGGDAPGERFSYLVRGPTVVLRFDMLSLEGPANHVHALWSDPEQDFGHDLIARHHAEHDHGAPDDGAR